MYIKGSYIIDEQGRNLILRGCTLGGSSQYPLNSEGAGGTQGLLTQNAGGSFIGRPFPVEEAETHFEQLQRRGVTLIRFIITWEALEHEGPGMYDEAYLAYLRKILLAAYKKNISVFIEPNQKQWSRWTGGNGAPVWTLEKIGINIDRLKEAEAILTQQQGGLHQHIPFSQTIWPANYNYYIAATMFTLFFAGNTYSPEINIEGERAQDWLQERYLAAMRHCYRRLKDCAAIIGWGTMNEPHPGFIGCPDLEKLEHWAVPSCPVSGYQIEAPGYTETVRASLFKEGYTCPWKIAGVWTDDGGLPRILKKDHFALFQGRPVNFTEDFLKPFINRFAARLREVKDQTFIFINSTTNGAFPTWLAEDAPRVIQTFHGYDSPSFFTKAFQIGTKKTSRVNWKKVQAYFSQYLVKNLTWTRKHMGDIPSLFGESGFLVNTGDIYGKKTFKNSDYRLQEKAFSLYYDAIDANLLHAAAWNYTADNGHEPQNGGNEEDRFFCSGKNRTTQSWLRPYPIATAGIPIGIQWNQKIGVFRYWFKADTRITAPTELFIPAVCFGNYPSITIKTKANKTVRVTYKRESERLLLFVTSNKYEREVEVVIKRRIRRNERIAHV